MLGGFDVQVDGMAVPADAWRLSKARSLLKLLALAGATVCTEIPSSRRFGQTSGLRRRPTVLHTALARQRTGDDVGAEAASAQLGGIHQIGDRQGLAVAGAVTQH
jgi:hypothetical protein